MLHFVQHDIYVFLLSIWKRNDVRVHSPPFDWRRFLRILLAMTFRGGLRRLEMVSDSREESSGETSQGFLASLEMTIRQELSHRCHFE